MRIEVKGRHMPVSDVEREYVARRFRKVDAQVSDLAVLEVELDHERNPAISKQYVADATLRLKGITLRARDSSNDVKHAIHLVEEEITRQVKKHQVQVRHRRDLRRSSQRTRSARISEA